MSDNYELQKSSLPQTVDEYTPYVEKQFNYVNDINNSVYSNTSGQTLVSFDLSAIYNSSKLTNTSEFYAVIPITMYFEYTLGENATLAGVPPGVNAYAQMSLKSGQPLINQCEVQWSGNTVKQAQPVQHLLDGIMLASEMDQTNLNELGRQYCFASTLDSYQSQKYTAGTGIMNNALFPGNGNASLTDIPLATQAQGANSVNRALQEKVSWYIDTTTNNATSMLSFNNAGALNAEFTPIFGVNGNLCYYTDYIIIPLAKIIDAYDKIGLTRRCDSTLRLWFQTGYLSVGVVNPSQLNQALTFAQANSTFTVGCPFTVNNIPIPANTTQIFAGIGVGSINQFTANTSKGSLAIPSIAHPMNACRLYYPLITLEPSKQLQYLESHKNKRIYYRNFYTSFNNNIGGGNNFSGLIQSGVRRILGVYIIPLVSSVVNANNFSQYQSPLDTCGGCSFSPISLTNLNVQLGGQNVLQNVMSYSWEEFWEQVTGINKMSSANEFGLNTGLISSMWWTFNRIYYIDCSRCSTDDFESTRSVNISFKNNSAISADIITYVMYLDSAVIDCYRGVLVSKD
jgi:hypothetical protein